MQLSKETNKWECDINILGVRGLAFVFENYIQKFDLKSREIQIYKVGIVIRQHYFKKRSSFVIRFTVEK
jgi:uncharacterized protein YqfB (UPF0267 family)